MPEATTNIQIRGFDLNDLQTRRIERRLKHLVNRLPEGEEAPVIDLTLDWHPLQRRVQTRLRVRHAPVGPQLVADASARMADESVRIATARIERQLQRRRSIQSGEPTYGVPSRRFRERSRRSRALRALKGQVAESGGGDTAENEAVVEPSNQA